MGDQPTEMEPPKRSSAAKWGVGAAAGLVGLTLLLLLNPGGDSDSDAGGEPVASGEDTLATVSTTTVSIAPDATPGGSGTEGPAGKSEGEPFDPAGLLEQPWRLALAAAKVDVGGETLQFPAGNTLTDCVVRPNEDGSLLFGGSSQINQARDTGPYFSITDFGDGWVAGGISGGQGTEEWIIGDSGSIRMSALLSESDSGIRYVNFWAYWSGEVTENFTSEVSDANVAIFCNWIPPEVFDDPDKLGEIYDEFRSILTPEGFYPHFD